MEKYKNHWKLFFFPDTFWQRWKFSIIECIKFLDRIQNKCIYRMSQLYNIMTTGTKDTNVLRFVIWVILKLFWIYFMRALKYMLKESLIFYEKRILLIWENTWMVLGPEKEMLKEPDVGRRILHEGWGWIGASRKMRVEWSQRDDKVTTHSWTVG